LLQRGNKQLNFAVDFTFYYLLEARFLLRTTNQAFDGGISRLLRRGEESKTCGLKTKTVIHFLLTLNRKKEFWPVGVNIYSTFI